VRVSLGSLILLLLLQAPASHAQEADTLERAHQHYQSGVSLFESGNKEQALVEFELANEIAPKPENVFMIAQCEYHLGKLVEARRHYRAYLAAHPQGELADLCRLRIEAINRRPGVFVINTVPDDVDVRIEGEGQIITSQAPNDFPVPHGRYRVTVSKPNYASETREIAIEVAETKSLFFKLEPIPAHLSVRTSPPGAALFVRGNRTQNPYVQDVPPGIYEIYAEASYYQPKRETIILGPGETREVDFPLTYVQRSGRPELIGFWTGIGAVGGGLAVLTQGDPSNQSRPLTGTIFGAGVLAGGLGLGVLSSTTPLVPSYIRDNLALFRIGAMWIGDLEGATLAMAFAAPQSPDKPSQSWTPTFLGGLGGLAVGAVAGWWLDDKAPNYGRVAMIQSAALLGTAVGALAVPAFGWSPTEPRDPGPNASEDQKARYQGDENQYRSDVKERVAWGMFAGLNAGIATGLALAYLPDQRSYGPSWQRVIMVDLSGIAGGLLAAAVEFCSRPSDADGKNYCANSKGSLKDRTARFALVGAGIGLITGWLLTTNYDQGIEPRPRLPGLSLLPLPSAIPIQSTTGGAQLLPGLLAQGRF
jgi:hypothetical protein